MPEVRELDSWTEVEGRLGALLRVDDPVLAAALADSDAAGMPAIAVSPLEGRLLQLVARIDRCAPDPRGGHARWLQHHLAGARAALGRTPHHARDRPGIAARSLAANLERAGLAERVEVRVGRASESLATIEAEHVEPFDLVFIDADKRSNPEYLTSALRLTRPGSVIVVDNVAKRLAEGDPADPDVLGTRRVLELMGAEPRLSVTALQTVGRKGRDGFALALVLPAT